MAGQSCWSVILSDAVSASPLSLFFPFLLSSRRGSGRFLFVGNMHSLPTRAHSEHTGLPISPGHFSMLLYIGEGVVPLIDRGNLERTRDVHFVFFLLTAISMQIQCMGM